LIMAMDYIEIHVNVINTNGDFISTAVSVRLPDDVARNLEDLAKTIERPKTYVIRKAIEEYLKEYADYLIALERLNDKDDKIISDEEMMKLLGIQD
jgi:RHH-type transcriptional regulator, rel operon repressor / antitoxin RelB